VRINRHELLKTVGYLGAALVAAGLIRWNIEGLLRLPSQIMLGLGGVMLLAALALNFGAVRGFFARRSARLGTNVLVLTASVLALLVVANIVGHRYHKRFDLTEEKLHSLSEQTRQIVAGLDREIRVVEFTRDPNPRLADLVREYRPLSRRFVYERVDPHERPDLARQYEILREGEVVVVAGERTERLPDFTEQDLTNTILKVTRDTAKTVCFLEGRGEMSLDSTEAEGFNLVERALRAERYQVRAINLVREATVPEDCTVVVSAGPTGAYFPEEVEELQRWLDAGGKALLLIDPDTRPGLGPILEQWNIAVGDNVVIDVSGAGRLFGLGPAVPLVLDYGVHPITRHLERSMTIFPLARTVSIADPDRFSPQAVELLLTSADSWAETEFRDGRAEFTEGQDTRGPVSLGVAAERDTGEAQPRLVVIGDSGFATNRFVREQQNGDLFFNTVNWLAEDEDLISVRPRSPADRRVVLTQAEQNLLFWLVIVLLPGAVLAAGVWIWWKRR
jgi:ABC-type uncharacterized transport system involved in gliding motility auxiliary subunit